MSGPKIELIHEHPGDPKLVRRAGHRRVPEAVGDIKVLGPEFWQGPARCAVRNQLWRFLERVTRV
jgi:hypothetical protein